MTNKNNLKSIIKNDFSKENNYNYILRKIGDNRVGKFKKVVLSSCLVMLFLICGIFIFSNYNKELKNDNQNAPTYKNKIVINKLESFDNLNSSIAGGIYDIAGGFYEKAVEELEKEYPFINHLFIFGEDTINQRIGEYRYDEENYQGYWIIYTDDFEKKGVEIFFSKTMILKPRDVGQKIILDELDDSYILNTPVKIINVGNTYIAFFNKDDIYFDIQTNNVSQEELISLIQSILK